MCPYFAYPNDLIAPPNTTPFRFGILPGHPPPRWRPVTPLLGRSDLFVRCINVFHPADEAGLAEITQT